MNPTVVQIAHPLCAIPVSFEVRRYIFNDPPDGVRAIVFARATD